MASSSDRFGWTTGGDPNVIHRKRIGRGGYSDVHELYDIPKGQVFARKLLHLEGPRIRPEDIENEARVIKKLCRRGAHPNIIEVLRIGELHGSPYYYIDMELCDLTLADYIYGDSSDVVPRFIRNVSSSLTEMQIWNVMKQIVGGVEFIHRHSEVHRDIKPSNSISPNDLSIDAFLVLYSRKDSVWKITDFGFTSEGSSWRIWYSSNSRGTSGYRAPELLQDQGSFNNKVDIWAMGCILFELATGAKAFESDYIILSWWLSEKQFNLILEDGILEDNAKSTISNIINRMIHRNPASRPSASILQEDICHIETAASERSLQTQELISEEAFTVTASQQPDIIAGVQHLQMKERRVGQEVDASTTIDHSPSSINDPISTIVLQNSSNRSHSPSANSPDKSPAASSDTRPVSKSATRAQIEGYNEELFLAAKDGRKDAVRSLLGAGAEVDAKDMWGRTPLGWAAEEGHADVVRSLLEAGAEVDAKDLSQRTPLSWAAANGHADVVRSLLEAGAAVDEKDGRQRTPLSWAAIDDHADVVKSLVRAGAEVDARDDDSKTPLCHAAISGQWDGDADVVNLLLRAGAEVDAKDEFLGWTPLIYAVAYTRVNVVSSLLRAGAEIDRKCKFGRTPLSYAVKNPSADVVNLLLCAGAEFDGKCMSGRTPLSYAAENGSTDAVNLLLRAGADVDSRDRDGKTALNRAREGQRSRCKGVVEVLEQWQREHERERK